MVTSPVGHIGRCVVSRAVTESNGEPEIVRIHDHVMVVLTVRERDSMLRIATRIDHVQVQCVLYILVIMCSSLGKYCKVIVCHRTTFK